MPEGSTVVPFTVEAAEANLKVLSGRVEYFGKWHPPMQLSGKVKNGGSMPGAKPALAKELPPTDSPEYSAGREIAEFLHAFYSYPECFAENPQISFQQHLSSISAEKELR